ncbi:MAG: YfhO family protein, partial [Candidatus Cloacimonetes bacterium]|nr:YfhO family protein [Candidatus Cloacimonadota bacterium]
ADKSNYRIYPVDNNIISNARLPKTTGEWAYYHQIVTGYSAAKLSRYDALLNYMQDSVKGPGEWRDYLIGIFSPEQGEIPQEKPTNIMDMLSVKYLLHPEHLPYDSLLTNIHPVFDGSDNVIVYKNNRALPRAWFVDSVQKVAPADSILPLLRKETFNPRHLAYIETDIKDVQAPDSSKVVQTVNELHNLAYDVYTDKPSFLVLSEVYYPAGWKAKLDGKEIPIYPTNYVLRGVQIPAGQHKLELVFAPKSYTLSIRMSLIGLLVSLLTLIGGLIWNCRRINKVKEG